MLKYNLHLISGLYFELLETPEDKEYQVKFVEYKGSERFLLYEVTLKSGMWGKIPRRYMGDYYVEIWDGDTLKEEISFSQHIGGKRVFICFDSKSLGDTIAWMHYCLEFKKIYGCEVVVSTFLNDFFEKKYPELTFVGRGVVVENIVGMLELGWFYDKNREPQHPATIPLQQAATNILGLPEPATQTTNPAFISDLGSLTGLTGLTGLNQEKATALTTIANLYPELAKTYLQDTANKGQQINTQMANVAKNQTTTGTNFTGMPSGFNQLYNASVQPPTQLDQAANATKAETMKLISDALKLTSQDVQKN